MVPKFLCELVAISIQFLQIYEENFGCAVNVTLILRKYKSGRHAVKFLFKIKKADESISPL